MAINRILRASIFILVFIIGMLRETVANGKESWQLLQEAEGIREYRLQNCWSSDCDSMDLAGFFFVKGRSEVVHKTCRDPVSAFVKAA